MKIAEKNSLFSKFFTAVFMFLIVKSFKKYVHSKFPIFNSPPPCLSLFVLHVPPPTLPPPSTYVRFSELPGNEKKEVN